MVRVAKSGVDPIYEMHARWMSEVLGPGDALLTPGEAIWTVEHLDELERDFIGQPDETRNKRFLEKLHDQLASSSPGAIQLMAELHVVHFLIISNSAISAAKKLGDLETIWSWMPEPAAIPQAVVDVLAPGIVHPGQWVMTRRDTQLAWLIRFGRAWKDLSTNVQGALIGDPWTLKDFVEAVQSPTSDSARLALLHLAHPDTFEPIVSTDHKQLIVERFEDLAGSEDDVDRRLLIVRSALTDHYGDGFDWYADPLVHRWWKNQRAWSTFLGWLRRFRELPTFEEAERTYKLEVAAKLRTARDQVLAPDDEWADAVRRVFRDSSNNLTQWQVDDRFLTWLEQDREASSSAFRALWSGDDDPATRLREFFTRVPTTVLGQPGERLNIGSFLLLAVSPEHLPPVKISAFRKAWKLTGWGRDPGDSPPEAVYDRILAFLDELVLASGGWKLPLRDRLDAQGAVWALAKTSKKPESWADDLWSEFDEWRRSAPDDVGDDEELEEPENDGADAMESLEAVVTTSIDYVEAAARELHVDRAVLDEIIQLLDDKRQVVLYGPPGTGKTFLALRLAKAIAEEQADRVSIVQFHPATTYEDFFEGLRPRLTDGGQVTYERTDGPLMAIARAAEADPDHTYLLVIDEINRANLPKVFGELLFLLEYRNESARTLYRPDEPFRLPENLWFVGTMNTADRSVALIDAAMRRRFHFVPFFPHQGPMEGLLRRWLDDGGGRAGVADFLDAVNRELLGLVGEHLLIGPSHFMKTNLSDRALERIWTYNVFPLIEEQLWGNREEIERWRWVAVHERFRHALSGSPTPDVDDERADVAPESEERGAAAS